MRRFRNRDGSLTEEGKKRYSNGTRTESDTQRYEKAKSERDQHLATWNRLAKASKQEADEEQELTDALMNEGPYGEQMRSMYGNTTFTNAWFKEHFGVTIEEVHRDELIKSTKIVNQFRNNQRMYETLSDRLGKLDISDLDDKGVLAEVEKTVAEVNKERKEWERAQKKELSKL